MSSLNIEGRNVPQPTYEHNVKRLVRFYKNALLRIQGELSSANVTNLQRAQAYALQQSIRKILVELDNQALQWVTANIPNAAKDGTAASLLSLGLVSDMDEALKVASFNKVNEQLVKSAVAYTANDVLAITKTMDASIQKGIRDIAAIAVRENLTAGFGMRTLRDDMKRRIEELQNDLAKTADLAIRDAAGRRWTVEHYTETLARTVLHNVHTESVRNDALSRGAMYATISINPRTTDACRFHEGRVISLDPNAEGGFMTYEELKSSAQIFHPNCKHHILPFRRFDRLSENALEIAKKQEQVGRSAMAIGGRKPSDEDVEKGNKKHEDAFTAAKPKQQEKEQAEKKVEPKPKKPEVVRGHIGTLRYDNWDDRPKIYELVAKDMGIGSVKAKRIVESVREWSGSAYGDIRAIQRKELDPSRSPEAAQYAKDIDEYIRKSPKWGNTGATYRGIGVSRAVADNILLQLSKKNGKIDMLGAASWSSAQRVANNFSNRGEVKIVFVNNGATNKGTSMQHISSYFTEDEILVSKTAKYKALDIIQHNDNYYEIHVQEV